MRILDLIDYDALIHDPKVIIGFSDVVALLNAISVQTGLVTFHGPVAGHGDFSDAVVSGLTRAIMSSSPIGTIASRRLDRVPAFGLRGSTTGRVYGGNLSIVTALLATPYAVPTAGTVLLLEEVNEAPYRVDRMLTQLRLAGALKNASAIALGQFVHCVANSETDDVPSCTVEEALQDRFSHLRCPIVSNLPFGHIASQATIPIGVQATVDSKANTLTIDESAVT
jgi:muramoyltetrapeptide carboxypeptidase